MSLVARRKNMTLSSFLSSSVAVMSGPPCALIEFKIAN